MLGRGRKSADQEHLAGASQRHQLGPTVVVGVDQDTVDNIVAERPSIMTYRQHACAVVNRDATSASGWIHARRRHPRADAAPRRTHRWGRVAECFESHGA